jgi:hypothetical protein
MEAAAGRQQRREQPLIQANQAGQDAAGQLNDDGDHLLDPQLAPPPVEEVAPQVGEGRGVGLAAGSNDQVPRRLVRLKLAAPDLPHLTPQTIAGHRGRLKFRNDQSHPGVARRVVRPNHVQVLEAAAPALSEAAAKIGRAREPVRSRQARRCRQEPPCFEGSEMAICFRPFFRRRDSTARPQREAIRARNPCLLIRRLLRGRYDGFIWLTLQSEPLKLVRREGEIKTGGDERADGRTGRRAAKAAETRFSRE